MKIDGTVTTGLGKAAYFLSQDFYVNNFIGGKCYRNLSFYRINYNDNKFYIKFLKSIYFFRIF